MRVGAERLHSAACCHVLPSRARPRRVEHETSEAHWVSELFPGVQCSIIYFRVSVCDLCQRSAVGIPSYIRAKIDVRPETILKRLHPPNAQTIRATRERSRIRCAGSRSKSETSFNDTFLDFRRGTDDGAACPGMVQGPHPSPPSSIVPARPSCLESMSLVRCFIPRGGVTAWG